MSEETLSVKFNFALYWNKVESVNPLLKVLSTAAIQSTRPMFLVAAIDEVMGIEPKLFTENELENLLFLISRVRQDGFSVYSATDPETGNPCLVIHRPKSNPPGHTFGSIAIRNIAPYILKSASFPALPETIPFPCFPRHLVLIAGALQQKQKHYDRHVKLQQVLSDASFDPDLARFLSGLAAFSSDYLQVNNKTPDLSALDEIAGDVVEGYEQFTSIRDMAVIKALELVQSEDVGAQGNLLAERQSMIVEFCSANPGMTPFELERRMQQLAIILFVQQKQNNNASSDSLFLSWDTMKDLKNLMTSDITDDAFCDSVCDDVDEDEGFLGKSVANGNSSTQSSIDLTGIFGHTIRSPRPLLYTAIRVIDRGDVQRVFAEGFLPSRLRDIAKCVAQGTLQWGHMWKAVREGIASQDDIARRWWPSNPNCELYPVQSRALGGAIVQTFRR